MTEQELRLKWTREEYEEWKTEGRYGDALSYEEYLDFRRHREAEVERVIRELTEYYGEPPNEQPPELTEEDHRLLSETWAEIAREQQQMHEVARAA